MRKKRLKSSMTHACICCIKTSAEEKSQSLLPKRKSLKSALKKPKPKAEISSRLKAHRESLTKKSKNRKRGLPSAKASWTHTKNTPCVGFIFSARKRRKSSPKWKKASIRRSRVRITAASAYMTKTIYPLLRVFREDWKPSPHAMKAPAAPSTMQVAKS